MIQAVKGFVEVQEGIDRGTSTLSYMGKLGLPTGDNLIYIYNSGIALQIHLVPDLFLYTR